MVSRTPTSRDADLTYRARDSLFLCTHRGDGPPITSLGVVHIKKEKVPVGWHHIQRTPSGKTPELDQGNVILAYKRDYKSVIMRFKEYGKSGNDDDLLIARCFACLVGGVYSFDRTAFLHALEAFTSLDTIKSLPKGILTDFLSLVQDAMTAYLSVFNREVYIKVLKWMRHVYNTRYEELDTRAFMSMLHMCMFFRKDDARENVGKFMLQNITQKSRKQRQNRDDGKGEKDDEEWLCGIVKDLADHVVVIKSEQNYRAVIRFTNVRVIDTHFQQWVTPWMEDLFPDHYDRFLAASITLLAKVSSEQLPRILTAKSEVIKRRIHALKLLVFVLEESVNFFRDNVNALLLLRRIVFTSFVHSAINAIPAIFNSMWRLYEILWSPKYRQYLKFEIGVLLDVGFVGLLKSQFCTPPQKVDLLEGIIEMFKDKEVLLNIFYNYDTGIYNWPVCQKLINAVAKLTEGGYLSLTAYKEFQDAQPRVVEKAVSLLSTFMESMVMYVKSSGLNAGGNLDDQQDFDTLGTDYDFGADDTKINEAHSTANLKSTQDKPLPNSMQNDHNNKEEKKMENEDVIIDQTWEIRYDDNKEEANIIQQALKKARQDKIKTAVKFLLAQGGRYATLKFIAQFLYSNEKLDKEEVGEFISALETSALTQTQHRDLLSAYFRLLNFTGQAFHDALRSMLTDCGYRLPKEAQKIDRLIEAFSRAFMRDNPGIFKSADQPLVLAYGVLMMSTPLHSPPGYDNRKLNRTQFMNLVQTGNSPMPADVVAALYDSLSEKPLEMRTYEIDEKKVDAKALRKQFRNECQRLTSKSRAKLRDSAVRKHSWHHTKQIDILKALYEGTWHQFLAAITTVLRQTQEPQTQSVCLDAIKYSCVISICLGLNEQLHAFGCELARFVYIEQNKHLLPNVRHLAVVRGEHLKQQWFRNMMNLASKSTSAASAVVSHVCNDMQARVIYDADQKKLKDIEVELGKNLYLVHPDRRFIHAGPLTKHSTKGDLDLYRFYLFNDLLVYASGNPGNLSVRRVLHLSLCKLVDLRDGFIRNIKNAFRIVSPQKPIVLIATTAQEKDEWFQLIQAAIQEQEERRSQWINENLNVLGQESHATIRFSRYLGRAIKPKKHEVLRIQTGTSMIKSKLLNPDVKHEIDVFNRSSLPCKLCQRPFKRFTRKAKCPWCLDIVCKECLKREVQLPRVGNEYGAKKAKVCDACFGAITYFVAENNSTP